jgi:hypothetical protein
MRNAKNQHSLILDTVNDDVFPHRKTPAAYTKIVFAGAAPSRDGWQEEKTDQ